ncbi:MAG: hypothetical protein ABIS18_07970 [Actinomycetota bacterium]
MKKSAFRSARLIVAASITASMTSALVVQASGPADPFMPAPVALSSHTADPALDFSATPALGCGIDDLTETTQGRVPLADFSSGRAALGYRCNTSKVSQVGSSAGGTGGSGGYRVFRYTDAQNHVCAIYDTTLLFPANAQAAGTKLSGTWVLDMTDPANPIHTATLMTPAMQSPHESLSLNQTRGLLGAVFANPAAHHGQLDLYDVSQDCRKPTLKSSLPVGILGHEGSFSKDGLTYYASSLYGHTLAAIDVANPTLPVTLWTSPNWNVHGFNLSDDGNKLYFADKGNNGISGAGSATPGLTVLDVSQIQARTLNPQVSVISHITWPHVGTPQTTLPVTIGGASYLIEVDEFGKGDNVGAARIIDIANPAAPKVVSNIRLAVNNLPNQSDTSPDSQSKDPNATNSLAGYAGHYCGVPKQVDPGIVACTFILSGLRVFDIRDPLHPVEIAYFNQPSTEAKPGAGPVPYGAQGSYAMSQPAFDFARRDIWYSDGNSGFYVVHLNNNVWPTT